MFTAGFLLAALAFAWIFGRKKGKLQKIKTLVHRCETSKSVRETFDKGFKKKQLESVNILRIWRMFLKKWAFLFKKNRRHFDNFKYFSNFPARLERMWSTSQGSVTVILMSRNIFATTLDATMPWIKWFTKWLPTGKRFGERIT